MASYEQAKALLSSSVSRRTLYSIKIHDIGRDGNTDPDKNLTPTEKDYLKLFASNLNLPGISTKTMSALGQENMGIMRLTPNEIRHGTNQFSMQVIENSNFTGYDMMRKLFDQMATNSNPIGAIKNIRMKYYDTYVRNIVIDKLEFANKPASGESSIASTDLDYGYKRVGRFTFEKCYVSNIGEITLDSSAFDDYLTFPITFTFESFHYNNAIKLNDGTD